MGRSLFVHVGGAREIRNDFEMSFGGCRGSYVVLSCRTQKNSKRESAFNRAVTQFTEGARFILKNIAFVKDSKASYLSAPKRDVINLAQTATTPVLGLGMTSVVQPCPTGTVGHKVNLQQNQRFDITVLMRTVSAQREAGPARQFFDVECIDGSMN